MEKQRPTAKKNSTTTKNKDKLSAFKITSVMLLVVVAASVLFLLQYSPAPNAPQPQISFEQKMAHLESGAPLPNQGNRPELPRWMVAMILGFIVIQILPLLLASHKTRAKKLTQQDLRQIEYLAETPLYLGLLGSLLGVCMTHFLSGTLSAPLAYLTTISGILLYLFGRFTILLSVPSTNDLS